ncbi:hypothetical protein PDESU_00024 [Pontiella desulfatans]|uniref:Uncharacterized protein n=1 Tax=Pontiella desulfatans TaxID=2750659 RepID=A0A6C2TV57_PONDE|nr:hypothetical protein [Pontiella desulfatans]VGO11480.1 hypothetical protein PDESU_00024 [Pontiella desulfatans]
MKNWIYLISVIVAAGCNASTNEGSVLVLNTHTLSSEDGWEYIDNGTLKIGVDRSRGACIGFFGESQTGRNLLNHFDEGRFIQQSYYGQADGSDWNGKPWVYNPIQGGSWLRVPAKVHEFNKAEDELYAKIEPRHWASGVLCPEMVMQQTITLDGDVAKISFSMKYDGPDQGEPRHQELPAVFIDGALPNFYYTKNGTLTNEAPRILAENGKEGVDGLGLGESTSEWVAYLDDTNWGIGIFTPGTTDFTVYRALGDGTTGEKGSACSYVAPLRTFALTKGLEVEYDVYLTIGTLKEITRRFSALKLNSHLY